MEERGYAARRGAATGAGPGAALLLLHDPVELGERLALDLAHALPRQADALADLLERHRLLPASQAVAQAQDQGLALVDLGEELLHAHEQVRLDELLVRRARGLVL